MRRYLRLILAAVIVGGLMPLVATGSVSAVDAIVSDTCDEAELDSALAFVQSSGGGTITIDCTDSSLFNFTTEKVITGNVVIDGSPSVFPVPILDAGGANRHFTVNPGASLTLEAVDLQNGAAADGGSIYVDGGTLRTRSGLTLIRNSSAFGDGGGVYNNAGLVEILANSRVLSNEAGNNGGGIYNNGGTVLADNGLVVGNQAVQGGGIFNNGGTVAIRGQSTLSDNEASASGAGIENPSGSVSISSSQVFRNTANGKGGGIQNEATLTIENSAIYDNESTAESGGGINNALGGSVTITRSSLTENIAATRGGGLRNGGNGSMAIVETSTFSSNIATGNQGGGILNQGDMTIANSTIAFNESGTGGGGVRNTGTMDSGNTLYADNVGGGDCSGAGTYNSLDHNMDTDGTCPFGMPGDFTGTANLEELEFDGSHSHLPGPGSDAIDAGPLTCNSPDQRGETRPRNGICDIGAVEVIPPPDVCVNAWTGQLQAVAGGDCDGQNLRGIVFEDFGPHYLCPNPFTGILSYSYSTTCQPYSRPAIELPTAAPLSVCLKTYTRQFRLPRYGQTCAFGEQATTLS